jgi:hydroxypyruvate isomerase
MRRQIGAEAVHVMAGFSKAGRVRRRSLPISPMPATGRGRRGPILIEPLNGYDAPGYFLRTTGQARAIIDAVGDDALRLMFDCYHVQLIEGDLTHRLEDLLPIIGHIQFASVPDRGAPDHGEVDYGHIFGVIKALGYDRPLGAEYKPGKDTDATLGWLRRP